MNPHRAEVFRGLRLYECDHNGVTINAGPNDVVILRGLQIDGGPLGSNSWSGVRFIAGKALQIQHCVIRNFTGGSPNGYGVSFTPVGAGELDVVDSTIVTNGQEGGNQSIGAGIFIAPTGTPDVNATLTNLQILNNTNGIRVDTSGATGGAVQVTVRETVVQNSAAQGVSIVSGGGGTLDQVMLDRVSIVNGKAGVVANGATAAVFISNSIVTGNNRGFTILNSGEISSYGNNNVVGNATDGLEFLTPIGTH